LINEEGRKAGKKRPTARPAVRVEQWEKQRIVVPEEESLPVFVIDLSGPAQLY